MKHGCRLVREDRVAAQVTCDCSDVKEVTILCKQPREIRPIGVPASSDEAESTVVHRRRDRSLAFAGLEQLSSRVQQQR